MPDHDPFLTAIAEQPGDDTLRLVYADWLDENGLPDHAAFLRLEVRLRHAERGPGWFALCRAFLRAANATPDDWREQVSRPRLPGTTWRFIGPEEGDSCMVGFEASGRLRYQALDLDGSPEEIESPGTWRQFGPRVELVINSFSAHRGTIRGSSLPLLGWNLLPHRSEVCWQWTLTRVPGPDCIPDVG